MTKTTTTLGAITPGEAEVKSGMNVDVILRHNGTRIDFGDAIYHPDHVANARLYADAHNTAQKTGKLPSQLKQDVDELVVKLREAEKCLRGASEWMHVKRARMPIAEIDAFLSTLDLPKP